MCPAVDKNDEPHNEGGAGRKDTSLFPKIKDRKEREKKTKIYEVFMSMSYHSFSLWSPVNRSEVWLHVTVAESPGLSWWMHPATAVVLYRMCMRVHEHRQADEYRKTQKWDYVG